MSNKLFKRHYGVVVPAITPLTPACELDEEALERLIEHFIAGGVQGVFVLGTTGEAASLPKSIRYRLVEKTVDLVDGRVRVYAGIADNCLADAVDNAKRYHEAGVGTIVVRLPSFFPLDDREQLEYLSSFVGQTSGDIMIYNMPALTRISISIDMLERLSCHKRVVGVKDSAFDAERLHQVIERLGNGEDFSVFTGPASMAAEMVKAGADGIIPAFSNALPGLCVSLYNAAANGDADQAKELQAQLDQVGTICRGLPSPSALKCVVSALGLCGPTVMPPLNTLGIDDQKLINARMSKVGILAEDATARV